VDELWPPKHPHRTSPHEPLFGLLLGIFELQ
jgi:hypothetical protein